MRGVVSYDSFYSSFSCSSVVLLCGQRCDCEIRKHEYTEQIDTKHKVYVHNIMCMSTGVASFYSDREGDREGNGESRMYVLV